MWTENFLVNKTVGVGGSPQKHIVIDPTSGNQFLYPGAATGSHTGPKSQTMEFMCVDVGVEAGSGYAATVESYAHSRCEAMCEADSTCGCFSVSADDGGSQPVQSFPVGGRPGESAPAGSSITFFTYNGLPALTSAQKESLNPLLYAFQVRW